MPSIIYSEIHNKINDNGIVNQYDKKEMQDDKHIQGLVNINGTKYKYNIPKSKKRKNSKKHVSFLNNFEIQPKIVNSFYRTPTPYPIFSISKKHKSRKHKSRKHKSLKKR